MQVPRILENELIGQELAADVSATPTRTVGQNEVASVPLTTCWKTRTIQHKARKNCYIMPSARFYSPNGLRG